MPRPLPAPRPLVAVAALVGLSALVTAAAVPSGAAGREPAPTVRFATFNASLSRFDEGELVEDLSSPDDPQAAAVAAIIQAVRPDVLAVNEFDYDVAGRGLTQFQRNYLGVSQGEELEPIHYPYAYAAPSNTGVASGLDLDNDGEIGGPGDAYGFGFFEGQFGMAVLSEYPIETAEARTFQRFLWKDMPDALLPVDPETGEGWYGAEELEAVRLSSKSHWDLPVRIGDEVIHLLASHPTPPVFDGPEDRNGTRNHDEIRFWADYVDPDRAGYIYDDQGRTGGLAEGASFVIAGDQNADPFDGDSTGGAINQLLEHPRVLAEPVPTSEGGPAATMSQGGTNADHAGDAAHDTGDLGDESPNPGNLRVDYVLPDAAATVVDAGVYWPAQGDGLALVEAASDHRLVWVDLAVPAPAPTTRGADPAPGEEPTEGAGSTADDAGAWPAQRPTMP